MVASRSLAIVAAGAIVALGGVAFYVSSRDNAAHAVAALDVPDISWGKNTSGEIPYLDQNPAVDGKVPSDFKHNVCDFTIVTPPLRYITGADIKDGNGNSIGEFVQGASGRHARVNVKEGKDCLEPGDEFTLEITVTNHAPGTDNWTFDFWPTRNREAGSIICTQVASTTPVTVEHEGPENTSTEIRITNGSSTSNLTGLSITLANLDGNEDDPVISSVSDVDSTFTGVSIDDSTVTLTGGNVTPGSKFWIGIVYEDPVAGDLGASITTTATY